MTAVKTLTDRAGLQFKINLTAEIRPGAENMAHIIFGRACAMLEALCVADIREAHRALDVITFIYTSEVQDIRNRRRREKTKAKRLGNVA